MIKRVLLLLLVLTIVVGVGLITLAANAEHLSR